MCVLVNNVSAVALVDSGSQVSLITEAFRRTIKAVATPWHGGRFVGADGVSFGIQPFGRCRVWVSLNGFSCGVETYVVRSCVADLLLGFDFLKEHGALVDCRKCELRLLSPLDSTLSSANESKSLRVIMSAGVEFLPNSVSLVQFTVTEPLLLTLCYYNPWRTVWLLSICVYRIVS